jgi:hypothetical protein
MTKCSGNLHATWDTCLVRNAVGPDVADAATDLIDGITPENENKVERFRSTRLGERILCHL